MATLNINGEVVTVDAEPDTPLLWVIREHLQLTGTKFGCGLGQCGACMVHIDGESAFSCITPLSLAENRQITTIEGLSEDSSHPLQKAWVELEVPQCGYCQSGQIMRAADLLARKENPSHEEIVNHMSTNLCRCATYPTIVEAIKLAAADGNESEEV